MVYLPGTVTTRLRQFAAVTVCIETDCEKPCPGTISWLELRHAIPVVTELAIATRDRVGVSAAGGLDNRWVLIK
jgi:hypothetical protein